MTTSELSPEWFERQLTLKGLTSEEFRAVAGLGAQIPSRIRSKKPLSVKLKVRIVAAFAGLPDVPGMAEALAPREVA